MTVKVILSDAAREQARRIDDWWRSNRQASPALFTAELIAALRLLADSPGIGRRYEQARTDGARRLHLRRTRFHVYYTFDSVERVVAVVAIWSALRERPPL